MNCNLKAALTKQQNRDAQFYEEGMYPGKGLPYIKGGDARREISNEPLKGTNLGVANAEFLPPKGTNQKHRDKQLISLNLIAIKINYNFYKTVFK